MKVSELGEFGLIKRLTDVIDKTKNPRDASWRRLLISIGDDAAVWKSDGLIQLATTDSLIQDIHFDPGISTWEELGWKSMAANLSDIAAMGGIPQYALVSLALPGDIEADCISSLYLGMTEIGNQFGVAIVGGNISAADKVMITITVIGGLTGKKALTRSAARVGEQVAVSGYTGLAAAGLKMLRENLKFDDATSRLFREAYLKPMPQVKAGQILVHCGVKAAIDISDGLLADLAHICQSSKVGARVIRDMVPIHPSLQAHFRDDCQRLALGGGEDYALLFTASSRVITRVKKMISFPVSVIGEIINNDVTQVALIDAEGNNISPQQWGWEHFKSEV